MDPLRDGDPRQVGEYRLLGRLGEGGMGRVFLGVSPSGRKVAVKVMKSEFANDLDFRRRFTREVAAARLVGGFHTAPVVDAAPDADPPWMVTAFIPGPSLLDAVKDGGLFDESAVRALGAGLAEGLAAIHRCGLIHRDLKPGNIIMAEDGPRIIDFGIAHVATASTLTVAGAVFGSYAYMSPEQINGDPVTAKADVFALGALLTFAGTGNGPFDHPQLSTLMFRILTREPDLGTLGSSLRATIRACLDKSPDNRPTVAELLAFFTGETETLRPTSRPERADSTAESTVIDPRARPTTHRPRHLVDLSDPRHDSPPPDTPRPDTPHRDSPRPDTPYSDTPRPDTPHRDSPRPDTPYSDTPRPDTPRPGEPRRPPRPESRTRGRHLDGNSRMPRPRETPVDSQPDRLTGHAGPVRALMFSLDGSRLVSAGDDQTVRVWDAVRGRQLARLTGHAGAVRAVVCSPDATQVISHGTDQTARRWEAVTGRVAGQYFMSGDAVFSPDGRFAARSFPGGVAIQDAAGGRLLRRLDSPYQLDTLAFSRDGARLAALSDQGVHVWHGGGWLWAASYQPRPRPAGDAQGQLEPGAAPLLALSFDGALVVTALPGGAVELYEVIVPRGRRHPGQLRRTYQTNGLTVKSAVALSPDGARVAFGTPAGTVELWDTDGGRQLVGLRELRAAAGAGTRPPGAGPPGGVGPAGPPHA
ncbi:protein kinase, partial [Frankia sp. CNm7]|uniref:WD40 repeat domain-containing serine/threonine protein kinase n=1 Tax=Frankia nepalensis TaxID=1836974 RepID=UPI00193396E5